MEILPATTVTTVTTAIGDVLEANIAVIIGLVAFSGAFALVMRLFRRHSKVRG